MKKNYHIRQLAFVPPPYGGVSVYVKRLIDCLVKDGFTVGAYYMQQDNSLSTEFYDKWEWMQTSRYIFKIRKYIKETKPYVIVHSHFGMEAMLYLWTLKTFFKKKIIITVHNSMVEEYYSKTNFINRFFLKIMLASDVQWITVSEQGRKQLYDLGLKIRNPIRVISPYIPDLSNEESELDVNIDNYIKSHTQNIVFYAHSFMEHNGVDVYGFKLSLDVYSELMHISPNVGFILCLAEDRDTDKINDIMRYAKDKSVYDSIYWQIGPVSSLKKLWTKVDVYFRPTTTDGDSVAVREAIDEGVRVVASDVAIRPKGTLVFKNGDILDALSNISKALSMPRVSNAYNMSYYEEMKSIYMENLGSK